MHRRVRKLLLRRDAAARRVGRRLGYHVLKADYYSAVPDYEALPDSTWEDAAPMPGVDLRIEASATFLETELAPFVAEYAEAGSTHGYRSDNPMYPKVDGEVLYAMLRHLQPRRIVEVGAGWSTRVIRDALARNERPTQHRLYDPFPDEVATRIGDGADLQPLAAQDIPLAAFAELEAGDVLFIDTTHTVKAGSDVLRLLLEVLPTIAPGVVIHVHDFFRPFEYPRFLMADYGIYWQEHYLLQAFLAFNDDFEVLIANHALVRLAPERAGAVIPGIPAGIAPGSALWLRRREA